MFADFVKLVYVSLKNRRVRSWLTMIGIFIGIAAVVSLIGLGEGLRAGVMNQFNFLSTDVLSVQAGGTGQGPPGTGVVNPLTKVNVVAIGRISGVDLSIGRMIENAKVEFNGRSDFTFVTSIPHDNKLLNELYRIAGFEIANGHLLTSDDSRQVVLGSIYASADEFGVAVEPRDQVIIQGREFEAVGLLKKKGSFITDNAVLMMEDQVKDLFGTETYDIIAVKVADVREMGVVKDRIEKYLRKDRDVDVGEEDFQVDSPHQHKDSA